MSEILQQALVALVVLWAAWTAFCKLLPASRRRLQQALATLCVHPGRPRWLRRFGLRLLPAPPTSSGCGNGCSRCDGCGVAPPGSGEQSAG